jgi:hypothetical protein
MDLKLFLCRSLIMVVVRAAMVSRRMRFSSLMLRFRCDRWWRSWRLCMNMEVVAVFLMAVAL